ncbi:single-stranded-DNA-specific exonuclease RecJ [Candidatus Microgenomates bacterium]|nr:single-stranded-DNA-specific exonuclease RecJ [Candidatus Microgenomates bacterium]
MKIYFKHEIKLGERVSSKEIVDLLLKERGITDVAEFLTPKSPLELDIRDFDKTYKKQMDHVLKLLETIYEKQQMVVVYTDYDADGVTGGAILWETLHLLGFKAMPYVPHRVHEGYGFSIKGIENVKKEFDPALIISVDHGITAREKIAHAQSLGIPVVVTDHHMKPELIPDKAEAIFHIPLLSGSGVSYFFSKAIYDHFKTKIDPAQALPISMYFQYDYQALAAIGTVADLVPLVGPSRSLVYHGLSAFAHMKRYGILEILKSAGYENRVVTPYEIGFIIAPRINAIGRLEHALDALRLLCTTDPDRARTLATRIGDKNTLRQDLVKTAIDQAYKMMKKEYGTTIPKLIVLKSDQWHEGIIGLIASKIVEKYFRPVIIMTKTDGHYKGSARSIPAFHMTKFLTSHRDMLVDMGGHAQAAGFTVTQQNTDAFVKAAQAAAELQIQESDLEKIIEADLKIPLSYLNLDLAHTIQSLAPFGIGNPQPVFVSDTEIKNPTTMGKTRDHLKFFSDHGIEFVCFGKGELCKELKPGEVREVVYKLEINNWNGQQRLQGKIIHM